MANSSASLPLYHPHQGLLEDALLHHLLLPNRAFNAIPNLLGVFCLCFPVSGTVTWISKMGSVFASNVEESRANCSWSFSLFNLSLSPTLLSARYASTSGSSVKDPPWAFRLSKLSNLFSSFCLPSSYFSSDPIFFFSCMFKLKDNFNSFTLANSSLKLLKFEGCSSLW